MKIAKKIRILEDLKRGRIKESNESNYMSTLVEIMKILKKDHPNH